MRTANKRHEFRDGLIDVDTPFAKKIGFTSDKFEGDVGPMKGSYLWKSGNRIMISLISSVHEGQGNLSALFKAIEARGYRVAVPTPLGHMEEILKHKGFVPHWEKDTLGNDCEVWEKP